VLRHEILSVTPASLSETDRACAFRHIRNTGIPHLQKHAPLCVCERVCVYVCVCVHMCVCACLYVYRVLFRHEPHLRFQAHLQYGTWGLYAAVGQLHPDAGSFWPSWRTRTALAPSGTSAIQGYLAHKIKKSTCAFRHSCTGSEYRGTSPMRKRPAPWDPLRILGMGQG
jgi:hypothetical protein